jgi:hypothetical protein
LGAPLLKFSVFNRLVSFFRIKKLRQHDFPLKNA